MNKVPPPPRIEIEGTAETRGLAYGRAADGLIKLGVERYRTLLSDRGCHWDSVVRAGRLLAGRLEASYPEQFRELKAIAKGAGVDLTDILLINGRSEILNATEMAVNAEDRTALDDGCTAAVAMPERTAEGRLLHGQNWDWRPECEETTVVLVLRRDDGPDIMTYVEAGGLARAGFNEAGVAITGNNLQTADESWSTPGIPLSVIRRLALEADGFPAAMQVVAKAPRTVSNNMMISCATGGGEAFDLETTPQEIFWIAPENGLLTHANHFVSPAAQAKVVDAGLLGGMDTLYRDRRVRARLDRAGTNITLADFADAFSDRFGDPCGVLRFPVSRNRNQSISATVATILMDAGGGVMQVRQSPYKNEDSLTYTL
ncbi:C45 family autoproteolytic acyltransferase/hydolase [Paracoccus alkanivorans]|uniref:Peptidase C45 hydrolase domain-containing protein n=1 Tax=Paracoccus alkanivorans TaxID=2116655 RepID=A0A3M0MFA2_9RHOB|nr:C45 family peptidase [Paracoccus alkanivorans]RMC29917.1 hypothetical protein C9E81_22320 [Paracoccus alkanivorans]